MEELVAVVMPEGKNSDVAVAFKNSALAEIIKESSFTLIPDNSTDNVKNSRMVSSTIHLGRVILILWELDQDNYYRWKVDINIINDTHPLFLIEAKLKDGSCRRTDVSIVY